MYGEHLPTGRPNSVPLNPLFYRTTRMDTTAPTIRLDAEGSDLEPRVSPVCASMHLQVHATEQIVICVPVRL